MLRDIFPTISESGEGFVYIGLVITFAVILSFFAGIYYKLTRRHDKIIVHHDRFSPIWLFMAFGALLFSMGVPYIWHMEWLLDYVSFMRQFRSLGRFSWIFYYIIAVYAVVVIHTFHERMAAQGRAYLGYTVTILSILLWGYETSINTKFTHELARDAPSQYDEFFSVAQQSWPAFLHTKQLSRNDFQAILMVPFFHIGSDKVWVGDAGWNMVLACKASFQLHMPMIDQLLSRTSWSQTFRQVKIAGGPYVYKPMLQDLKTDKPFLLLHFERDSLDPDQKYLLQAADYIGHYSQCDVYAFYPARQLANDKKHADSISSIVPFMAAADTCIGSNGKWYVDHMDNGKAGSFFGPGAVPRITGEVSTIATIPIKPQADRQQYELSAWFLLSDKDYTSPCMFLETMDSLGNPIETIYMNTKWSADNHGMWFRGSVYFRLQAHCRSIRCRIENRPNPCYITMDELLIRPADALIISRAADGRTMANNHLLPSVQTGKK